MTRYQLAGGTVSFHGLERSRDSSHSFTTAGWGPTRKLVIHQNDTIRVGSDRR